MYYENFEKLCSENNVKPSQVSKATGIHTATLTAWKQDKYTPKQDKLQLIADYFNVSVDYLMTGKEPSDSKYDSEMATLVGKLRKDKEMSEALIKYFDSSIEIKKHIVSTINMLCDSSK